MMPPANVPRRAPNRPTSSAPIINMLRLRTRPGIAISSAGGRRSGGIHETSASTRLSAAVAATNRIMSRAPADNSIGCRQSRNTLIASAAAFTRTVAASRLTGCRCMSQNDTKAARYFDVADGSGAGRSVMNSS